MHCHWFRTQMSRVLRSGASLFCSVVKAHDLLLALQLRFCGLQLLKLFGPDGRIRKF